MSHCARPIFVFLVETGFHDIGQAGLEILASSDQSASASQSAGITGMSHCAQPRVWFCEARCPGNTPRWAAGHQRCVSAIGEVGERPCTSQRADLSGMRAEAVEAPAVCGAETGDKPWPAFESLSLAAGATGSV